MPDSSFSKIVLIGSGKVGHHLATRLHERDVLISQVYSRTKSNAIELARQINSKAAAEISGIDQSADLYILAVSDDAISPVAEQLRQQLPHDPLVVHTSGATASGVLKPFFSRYGILYPLQSFSPGRIPDFNTIPICIFANKMADQESLVQFAKKLSPKVVSMDDEQRVQLHLAAVFVNNFTNCLYQIGEQICTEAAIDFDLLKPLISETAAKINNHSPASMQTGPAIRKDRHTIRKHIKYLERHPELADLYARISRIIEQKYK